MYLKRVNGRQYCQSAGCANGRFDIIKRSITKIKLKGGKKYENS